MKKHIPNLITCGNLFCGCLAIISAFNGDLMLSGYLVIIAAVLDFMDGMMARVLNAYSEIGKQLDSLADMVTFGVVPGVIMFHIMGQAGIASPLNYFAFLITIFSSLRLAKFNVDTRQTTSFIGLPTPANTLFFVSLVFVLHSDAEIMKAVILQPAFLFVITVLMSLLMVAEIPMFSLKFKNLKWSDNKIQFIFLACSLVLGLIFFYTALPMIILLYVALSAVNSFILKPSETK